MPGRVLRSTRSTAAEARAAPHSSLATSSAETDAPEAVDRVDQRGVMSTDGAPETASSVETTKAGT
jgi:hypothetical protein